MTAIQVFKSSFLDRLEMAMWPSFLWGLALALPAFLLLRSKVLPKTKQLWLEAMILTWIGGTVLLVLRTPDWAVETGPPTRNWIGVFWAVGASVSLVVWALSLLFAWIKIRNAAIPSRYILSWSNQEAAKLGLESAPNVRIQPKSKGFAVACVGSTVLVSADFPADLSEEQARAVLRHELGHVARGHWMRWMLISGLQSLVFWHPLGWWLCQQLQIERELECDDIAREEAQLPYAEALLRIGKSRQSMLQLSLDGLAGTRRWKRLPDPVTTVAPPESFRTQIMVACTFAISLLAVSPLFQSSQTDTFTTVEKAVPTTPVAEARPIRLFKANIVQIVPKVEAHSSGGSTSAWGYASGSSSASGWSRTSGN